MHGGRARVAFLWELLRWRFASLSRGVAAAAVLCSSWQVVRWYATRLGDGGDEPWGLVALGIAVALTPRSVWSARISNTATLATVGLVLAAAAGAEVLPMLARAALTALAVGTALGGGGGAAGRNGLLVLSLPVMATVQFYAGYPLRLVTAELDRVLLGWVGIATERVGVVLRWSGGEVAVDAPCSGVRMLWTGGVLLSVLAAAFGLGAGRATLLFAAGAAGLVAANALRAAALFPVESGLWRAPAWVHPGVGLLTFGGFAMGGLIAARWLAKAEGQGKAEGVSA